MAIHEWAEIRNQLAHSTDEEYSLWLAENHFNYRYRRDSGPIENARQHSVC